MKLVRLGAIGLLLAMPASAFGQARKDPPDPQPVPIPVPADNGIAVSPPKIYDDRTLQLMMLDLAGRLNEVTGFDRASIVSKFGALQGYSSSQTSFGVQVTGRPVPGTESTIVTGTPSVVTTTATQYPGTTETVPSNTSTAKTTAGAFTPGAPALPTYGSPTAPTAFSVSAIDALNEQVQLNYELMNLRLLLGGALSDDYMGNGIGRRHITFGFPISVDAPRRYRNAVAEVTVTICNPDSAMEGTPILQNVLPKEKTYNVASLVSRSSSLGVGAILANVVSIGGSFLQGRQTYYVVRDQDTIALQRIKPLRQAMCSLPDEQSEGRPAGEADSVSFAWQFRPVLGRPTIQQGMRQTFAQIAFPPGYSAVDAATVTITVTTCWRKYDRKTGTAGDYIKGSCNEYGSRETQAAFSTTRIDWLTSRDNNDGTLTAIVGGTYPPGTRVGFGDLSSGPGNLGFSNVAGRLRFTTPLQLIATRGARIMSPDGSEREIASDEPFIHRARDGMVTLAGKFGANASIDIAGKIYALNPHLDRMRVVNWPEAKGDGAGGSITDLRNGTVIRADGSRCSLFESVAATTGSARLTAVVAPFSDSQVKITLPVVVCPEFGPRSGGPYPPVAVMAGRAYGLTDSPFIERNNSQITFLAPRAALQGQTTLVLKRLLAGSDYDVTYQLRYAIGATAGISIFSTVDDEVTFAVRGSQMSRAKIVRPASINVDVIDDTLLMFTMKKSDVGKYKAILLSIDNGAPTLLTLPAVKEPEGSKKPTLKDGASVSQSVPEPVVITGTNLKSVVAVQYLGKALPITRAASGESITITQIPQEMLLGEGMVSLRILFSDDTAQDYDLAVTP